MPHDHSNDGHHDHDHAPIEAADTADSPTAILAEAVRELLVEKGHFSAKDINDAVTAFEGRGVHNGAKLIARAWTDPTFKKTLLTNGPQACEDAGIDIKGSNLLVVENTPEVHNVIVCTLCSCYPVMLLGASPEWYKSRAYRARAVRDPRGVLREFGTEISLDREVRVHDSTADMRYMVLPMRPEGTDGLAVDALADLVTQNGVVGTGEI